MITIYGTCDSSVGGVIFGSKVKGSAGGVPLTGHCRLQRACIVQHISFAILSIGHEGVRATLYGVLCA